jgi:hypothetical protein
MDTNHLIDTLVAQARAIDEEYAEACFDSCCTNELPVTEAEHLVWDLVTLAYALNASGLADGPTFRRYVSYRNG